MLDNLSNKLQKILRNLTGQGRVSDRHIEETAREIRNALLDADVHFKIAKDFVERVKQRALGQEVIESLTPGQQVIKVVRDELVELLGGAQTELQLSKQPPSVFLMVGLQGSGKTTSTAKLAYWLAKNNHTPLLLSVDVYRPAAVEQLRVLCANSQLGYFDVPEDMNPVSRAEQGLRHARNSGYDVVLIDTAGRLHIDDEMMQELEQIRKATPPVEILLVADAMTGQDAVRSAKEFHDRLGLTGVVLTKMDGDARGGAALAREAGVEHQEAGHAGAGGLVLEPLHVRLEPGAGAQERQPHRRLHHTVRAGHGVVVHVQRPRRLPAPLQHHAQEEEVEGVVVQHGAVDDAQRPLHPVPHRAVEPVPVPRPGPLVAPQAIAHESLVAGSRQLWRHACRLIQLCAHDPPPGCFAQAAPASPRRA